MARRRSRFFPRRSRRPVWLVIAILAVAAATAVLAPDPEDRHATAGEPQPGAAARLEGVGRVIDGDTLDIGDVRVRLHGLDAFERSQTCDLPQGPWACGAAATAALARAADGRPLDCTVVDTDRYGRKVARCRQAGQDVGEPLVRAGLALAYRRYSTDYVAAEESARARGAGAWAGSFDRPEQWRRRGRRDQARSLSPM